jgi:hypothetical protein
LDEVTSKMPIADIFKTFIKRGSYFFLEARDWYVENQKEDLMLSDYEYLTSLPYLRDATLLLSLMNKNAGLLTDEILDKMLYRCASLKYSVHNVCNTQTRVVVGQAMFDVILGFRDSVDNYKPDFKRCIAGAWKKGSAEMLRYLLEREQIPDEDKRTNLLDDEVFAKEVGNGYYKIDYGKLLLAGRGIPHSVGSLLYKAAADIDDDAENFAKFLRKSNLRGLGNDPEETMRGLREMAREKANYNIFLVL